MPMFKPLAGFAPICAAVLVQIEHCAKAGAAATLRLMMSSTIRRNFFIVFQQAKIRNKKAISLIWLFEKLAF